MVQSATVYPADTRLSTRGSVQADFFRSTYLPVQSSQCPSLLLLTIITCCSSNLSHVIFKGSLIDVGDLVSAMSTTAPLEAAPQPHPVKSDEKQGSQYATARPQGDPEHDPMVFHEPRTGDETKKSTQNSVSSDQEHNQQSDQSLDNGALGRPSSNEAGAQCHEMGPIMWTREIETLKYELLELQKKIYEAPNKLSGQTSHAQEESSITPTEEVPNLQSDEYRRALENLYTHRRYWETTQGPGRWSSRLYRGDRRHVLQGYQGYEGPIIPEYDRAAYSSNIISSKK